MASRRSSEPPSKMSFSVRFNAEDEEVEGLCLTPAKSLSTGSAEELQLKTPELSLGISQYSGLFGLKRSNSSDAESSPCDTTIKRLDNFLADIKEGPWRNDDSGDLNMPSKKPDDPGQDDDSVSIMSNEQDNVEDEQIQYSVLDKTLFGIRRRRTKVITKALAQQAERTTTETAHDALEYGQQQSNIFEVMNCAETEPVRTRVKTKYAMYIFFGITGCYFSYKFIPMYINTFLIGSFVTYKFRRVFEMFFTDDYKIKQHPPIVDPIPDNETSIKRSLKSLYDLDPRLAMYKGWMNQFLYDYRPETYRLSLTVSVYAKLKGSILILSYPYYKVPKRSLFKETIPKLLFVKECMYKLSQCNVTLLPQNLVNKRKWSKKYPICVELHTDSLIGVRRSLKSKKFIQDTDEWLCKDYTTPSLQAGINYDDMLECEVLDINDDIDFKDKICNSENKKKLKTEVSQTDSKNERKNTEPEASTSKNAEKPTDLDNENDVERVLKADSDKIYLFARNDPEKELWFHRLHFAASFDASSDDSDEDKNKFAEEHIKLLKAYLVYAQNVYDLSNYPVPADKQIKKKQMMPQNIECSDDQPYLWLNMVLGRIGFNYLQNPIVLEMIADKFQKKLNAIRYPKVMDLIVIRSLCFGKGEIPTVRQVSKPWVDHRGIWFELEVVYNGTFQASIDTKLNLMKLKREEARRQKEETRHAMYHSSQEDSGETSNDEGHVREDVNLAERLFEQQALNEPPPPQESRMYKFMENCSSGFLELKFIRRVFENVAKKELTLVISVKQLIGTLVVNLPPPPTDRVWISFRGCPKINFEAKPKVNDTNVPLMDVLTKALHNILIKEFEKVMVLPNMIDFSIPMMNNSDK